jgi:SEC-C motif domain protein
VKCPCGTGSPFDDCCAPLHSGATTAATATALMRSRYSAFAVGDRDYLLRTWHSSTRPDELTLDPALRWERLEIVSATGGGPLHAAGTVEFLAHHRRDGSPGVLHEHSRFRREDGQWTYLDGEHR